MPSTNGGVHGSGVRFSSGIDFTDMLGFDRILLVRQEKFQDLHPRIGGLRFFRFPASACALAFSTRVVSPASGVRTPLDGSTGRLEALMDLAPVDAACFLFPWAVSCVLMQTFSSSRATAARGRLDNTD